MRGRIVQSLSMSDLKTYQGGCHCGAVRYQAKVDLTSVITCNCSICSKMGWMLTFIPESQFTLESGGDAMGDYQFGKKSIHHVFCKTCGTHPFCRGAKPDGEPVVAVNVRCLDGVDLAQLHPTAFDGKSL